MKKNLDIILGNTTSLVNSLFQDKKMEQLMFVLDLITIGFFSVNDTYKYNDNIETYKFTDKSLFNFALVRVL